MILRILGESDAFSCYFSILFYSILSPILLSDNPTTYRPKHDSLHPYARDGAVVDKDYAPKGLRSLFLNFGVLGDSQGQPPLRLGCRAPRAVIGLLLCRAERRDRRVPRCRGRRHVRHQRRHVHQGEFHHAAELGRCR